MQKNAMNKTGSGAKRRTSHRPPSQVPGRISQPKIELSEEEVDRRAWATANGISLVPQNDRSGRRKAK